MKTICMGVLLVVLAAASGCASHQPAQGSSPLRMTHIIYYYTGDVIVPGAPHGNAYEFWLVNRQESRLQLPPLANGMRTTVIYSGIDSWIVNLPQREVLHSIHDEPVSVRSPIFMVRGLAAEITELEFGHEREYFASRQTKAVHPNSSGELIEAAQQLQIGDTILTMYLDPDGNPKKIEADAPRAHAVVHYEVYESGLQGSPQLFHPPEGMAVKDATQRFILLQPDDHAKQDGR